MKRALLVATGLLAISTTTASAGGFLGLGLGTRPGFSSDLAQIDPVGRSLRGFGGYRWGNLSVEGALNGFGVDTGRGPRNHFQLSAAVRFNLPIGNNFEGFGRAGLERTWLSFDDARYDLSGNGFLVGGGIEYRLIDAHPMLAKASVFVDYTIHRATLTDERANEVGETSRMWALGFTFGF